jgi:predicted anti-sigma-YlaC factor YlaD
MNETGQDTPRSELVYLPEPSWWPPLFAAGLAGVFASFFTWWPYGVVGAIVAIVALVGMIAQGRAAFDRLPRRQRVTSAPIPPTTLKR